MDDLEFPDLIYGATVRSSIARGRIRGIRYGDGIPWNEFTIVTAADIPGKNEIALIAHDQPCLAAEFINHPEEPIVLLAHPDKYLLEEARRAVQIDVEPLPAIFTIEDSLAKRVIIWGEDNVFKSYHVEKGDVDAAWAHADVIVEGEYRTGAQEQLYIENQGMVAVANPADGVTVWGSLQCPYYVQKALIPLFGLPRGKNSRHSGGNRRRLRRQGRISIHDCRARGAAGVEVRKTRENRLRPRGRYGGHHQAPSVAHAASHRSHARRQTGGHGHRFCDRRRRVRDAFLRRALARDDSRGGAL